MNALPSLYLLAGEYQDAAAKLADLDLPPEVVADTLEGMAGDIEVKATNVAMFARNLESVAEQIKAAEGAMAARRKALEARAESVRRYLFENLQRTAISKISSPYFTLAIRDNPPAVVIDAPSMIPAEYMRQPDPPPASPDKKAIADAIKSGKEVTGAHLARTQRLEIK